MAETLTIRTATSTDVVKVVEAGPQGPAGSNGTNGQGVPVGGTTGQVLRKASGINYDTEWAAAGSGSGSVTSVALAGTGLSISGSPITASGTITANVSYGTASGTACQGNDSRLSDARTPVAHTHPSADITDLKTNGNAAGLWDSVNDEQLVSTGDGELQIGKTGTALSGAFNAGQLTADRGYDLPNASGTLALTTTVVNNAAGLWDYANAVTGLTVTDYTLNVYNSANASTIAFPPAYSRNYTLPNASGTLALTQQAVDYEVTDATKGVIMKSPNGSRWRLTIDNSGSLIRTIITLIFLMSFICGSQAQVRDLVYGTNNVVIGPTNTNALAFTNRIAFSNVLSFGTNAPTVRTNLGLGASWLTNSDSPATTNATNLTAGTLPDARLSTNVAILSNLPSWATTTNAATARTNLGVTEASNLPAPYSGAAASNSLLTADGAGSSAFVSTIPKLTIASGTITNTNPALTISQTWSNSNSTFTGLLVNITNTNSAAASLLADFQVGGTSAFRVRRDGATVIPFSANGPTTVGLGFGSGISATHGLWCESGRVGLTVGNDYQFTVNTTGITVLSELRVGDQGCILRGENSAANASGAILAQRNGTNPQTYNIYNNFSNSTNYERGKIAWTNSVMTIGTEKGTGGGTARALELQTDGTTRFTITTSGSCATAGNLFINGYAQILQTYSYRTSGRWRLTSDATSGRLILTTDTDLVAGAADFGTLCFGGTTTNFPALKRTNTVLQVRLADDSAYSVIDAQHRLQGTAPINSTDAGTAGDMRYDTNNFLYICVSNNVWRRTSLTNW